MANVDVKSEITGNVWKIVAAVGDELPEDEPVMILESMKMEIPVVADNDCTVEEIRAREGDAVTEDQVLLVVDH